MQIVKVGTYKSAVEPYILNDMSEANREQLTVLSNEMWGEMTAAVSKSRKISVEKLNEYAEKIQEIAKELAEQSADVAKAGLEGLKAGVDAAIKAYKETRNK